MTSTQATDSAPAQLRSIEADITAGRLDVARAALERLMTAASADPRLYLTAAMLALRENDPQRQMAALARAVQVAPGWWPAWAELAKVLSVQEHFGEALAAAQRLAELAPGEIEALEIAVAVANSAGDTARARQYLEAALTLRPGDFAIRRALGIALDKLHAHVEAEQLWRGVVADHPDNVAALGWFAVSLIALKRNAEAVEVLERALLLEPGNPGLSFHLTLARGETPTTQPIGTVQQLFDEYARRFDQHLEGKLHYQLPRLVADIIRAQHPQLDISVLDLGCGTGLFGAQLGAIKGAFVGVDLSRNMLEKAMKYNVYSRLRLNDLLVELREIAAGSFDYVAANDVFIYVGDLSEVIPATYRVLRPGGRFIFSCETAEENEGPLVLRKTRRFAHSRSSVEKLCQTAGFRNQEVQHLDLRHDGPNGIIRGFMVIAQK